MTLDAAERVLSVASVDREIEHVRAVRRDVLAARRGRDLFGGRCADASLDRKAAALLAGAAFVAYLSSITSKSHAAVQYALLSSLTVLVGSLGRAALGEKIDSGGYAPVFYVTAAVGLRDTGQKALGVISAAGGEWRTWAGGRIDQYLRLDVAVALHEAVRDVAGAGEAGEADR